MQHLAAGRIFSTVVQLEVPKGKNANMLHLDENTAKRSSEGMLPWKFVNKKSKVTSHLQLVPDSLN